jgi:FixJ family two-component response regulator
MAAAPGKIIVVEDDALMARALERLLRAHGFAVRSFSSAEAYLALGADSDTICLLVDIRLAGISGVELRRGLLTAGSNVPVIFITAFDSESTHREALEVGYSAYLLKPFSASALIDAITTACGLPKADRKGSRVKTHQ